MRILNILAALSGISALLLLVVSSHHMQDAAPAAIDNVRLAAFVQLGSAVAGIAIAGRSGLINLTAGALILAGAALFSLAVDTHAIGHMTTFLPLAPVSGVAMMVGWLTLAFAPPTKRPE
jgi:uncharacterized membrane protein YgdD (TMEM256/DUF423 family)